MPPIAEIAKFGSVSPLNESGVGAGSIVLKSGGEFISLALLMTIRCYAKLRGKSF